MRRILCAGNLLRLSFSLVSTNKDPIYKAGVDLAEMDKTRLQLQPFVLFERETIAKLQLFLFNYTRE
jgi:hypothetical protein